MDKPQGIMDLDFRLRRAALMLLYLFIFMTVMLILSYARPLVEFVLTILSPFIVAMIVAYVFNPIVTWLQKRFHMGRIAGVLLTYGLILGITIGFFAILVPVLYTQLREGITSIIHNVPQITEKATKWLKLRVSPDEIEQAKAFLKTHIDLEAITGSAPTAAGNVAQGAISTTKLATQFIGKSIGLIIGFFAFVTFVIVICFYFLLDYSRFEHIARVLLPDDKESRVFGIWEKIDRALGGFLRGQMIVAVTIGVLYTLGLMAMGMKEYAILIGFMAGFGNLIPYLGPILGGVPAGLWVIFGSTFDTGQEKLIGVGIIVAFSAAIQSLDGFFLQPRIVGKSAELHPLLVLLALLIGAQFGLGGMIVAVPAAIMVRVTLKELWWDPLERQEFENKRLAAINNTGVAALRPDKLHLPSGEAAARPEVRMEDAAVTESSSEGDDANSEAAAVAPTKRRRRRRR